VTAAECRRFTTVDLAWSMEERADFTVMSTWAVTPRKHLILLDVVRAHLEGPDIVRRMRDVFDRWDPAYLKVEKSTRQLSIIQEAVAAGLPVREVKADKDKVARALPATAYMEQGQVWFPRPAAVPGIDVIEAELIAFPMGEHDDFVDTLAYACLELMAKRRSAYADRGVMTV
jgi:predicted phage terminase large subunit-like protein